MHTTTFQVKTPQQFAEVIDKQENVTLAFVFGAITQDVTPYQEIAKARNIRLCGCSSAGEIVNGELTDGMLTGLLMDVPRKAFTSWNGLAGSIKEQSIQLGQAAMNTFKKPEIFILSGGLTVDGEAFVEGIKQGAFPEIKLFGGMAADDFTMTGTYCFSENDIITHGLSAIIFDGDFISLSCQSTSGWEAIGPEHVITKAKGNIVEEINGENAVSFFTRFVGELHNMDSDVNQVSAVSIQYPLQIQRPEGSLLRAPMMEGENGSIVLAGGVKTGDKFRFSISPGFDVIDSTVNYFQGSQLDRAKPDGVIMISCKARHAALGPMLEDEIEQINAVFEAPMAGFLSYGEIGSFEGTESAFHNDTCCMVSFREIG